MSRVLVRMPLSDIDELARVRHRPLKICVVGQALHLLAEEADAALESELRTMPGTRFAVSSGKEIDELIPFGCRLATDVLPAGPWFPIAQWLDVDFPPPLYAGEPQGSLAVNLVRADQQDDVFGMPANLIIVDHSTWYAHAVVAPEVRLQRWAFAKGEGVTVVRGVPLPNLVGQRFVEIGGVAAPVGWTWQPRVHSACLRELLKLAAGDVALLYEDGTMDLLEESSFIRATRPSLRASYPECRISDSERSGERE